MTSSQKEQSNSDAIKEC